MTQQRQHNNKTVGSRFGDTTWSKIFVGGLAWETQSETMKAYFQQFGDILEAVVIADKLTGKSKGYGFVTFKNPDSAVKACQDPYPVIDGRRANCNLASLGATRPPQQGIEQVAVARSAVSGAGGSMFYHQPLHPNAFAYSAYYGYPSYAQDMYTMNHYSNAYGGGQQQHYPYYYTPAPGVYYGYRPFGQRQTSPRQHPKWAQHPHLSQPGFLSAPTLASPPPSLRSPTDEAGSTTISATAASEHSSAA